MTDSSPGERSMQNVEELFCTKKQGSPSGQLAKTGLWRSHKSKMKKEKPPSEVVRCAPFTGKVETTDVGIDVGYTVRLQPPHTHTYKK